MVVAEPVMFTGTSEGITPIVLMVLAWIVSEAFTLFTVSMIGLLLHGTPFFEVAFC